MEGRTGGEGRVKVREREVESYSETEERGSHVERGGETVRWI